MYLNRKRYERLVQTNGMKYWSKTLENRWSYMQWVLNEIKVFGPKNICEAGTQGISLDSNSFVIDIIPEFVPKTNSICHDLNEIPFPLKDKQFDLFVALQVWEHLTNQVEAFKEVMRISHNAILSFPYKWKCASNDCHYNITKETIAKWTSFIKPVKVKQIGTRIIYVWSFK